MSLFATGDNKLFSFSYEIIFLLQNMVHRVFVANVGRQKSYYKYHVSHQPLSLIPTRVRFDFFAICTSRPLPPPPPHFYPFFYRIFATQQTGPTGGVMCLWLCDPLLSRGSGIQRMTPGLNELSKRGADVTGVQPCSSLVDGGMGPVNMAAVAVCCVMARPRKMMFFSLVVALVLAFFVLSSRLG